MKPDPSCPNRLLVEGKDDQFAVINLMMGHDYSWTSPEGPYVSDCGGITEMLSTLPVAAKSYRKLGAIIDADLSLPNRWNQVRSALNGSGLSLPEEPIPGGLILDGVRPNTKFGVWVMPDNRSPGTLEDFLSKLVPEGDRSIWELARCSTNKAIAKGAKLRPLDEVKGSVHTFLAWQEKPGLAFGTALNAKILDHKAPDAEDFVSWFRKLFDPAF